MLPVKNLSVEEMTSARVPDEQRVKHFVDAIERGQKLPPVIVDINRVIIDGEARVEAYRQLELPLIPGVVALDYETAIDALKRNHGPDNPTSTPRTAQIYQATRSLAKYYTRSNLGNHTIARPRDMLAEALGMRVSVLGAITAFYSTVNGPAGIRRKRAREVLKLVESGARTASWAAAYIAHGRTTLEGDVVQPVRQREVMNTVIASLRAGMRALQTMGPLDPSIKPEERDNWAKEIAQAKRSLQQFTASLRKERDNG